MLNKIILMGRLTRDPELRHTQANMPVSNFTLAVNRDFNRQQQEADFIDVVVFDKKAEFAQKWFRKGQLVAITGRLQQRSWTDRENNKRVSFEVVAEELHFAEPKRDDGSAPSSPAPRTYEAPPSASGFREIMDDDDGELPF